MPYNVEFDFNFLIGYVGYIIELLTVNGVPVYLIVLALVGVAFFFMWIGFLASFFAERFGN